MFMEFHSCVIRVRITMINVKIRLEPRNNGRPKPGREGE